MSIRCATCGECVIGEGHDCVPLGTLPLNEVKILVIGDRVWGRGETLKEALANASNPKQYLAYLCHHETYVDQMGYLVSPAGFRPKEFHRVTAKKTRK